MAKRRNRFDDRDSDHEEREAQEARRDQSLQRIERLVIKLLKKVTTMDARIQKLISDFDAETTAIATRVDAQTAAITDLKAQIAAGTPVSAADLDEIVAGLQPISDRLQVLGSDPAQPIPLPVTPPV
jgi:hypothetical protein